jgi:RES domain-containing protein
VIDIAARARHGVHDRTIRLVATARLRDPVLLKLVGCEHLDALAEIEGATSERLRAERVGSGRLDSRELVYGLPHAVFINAAFAYWLPRQPNRFNGPGRGAWYAAFRRATCVAEVAFHMTRELDNVGDFHATVDYAELFASFVGSFVDLRGLKPVPDCLDPDPARGYSVGNRFAEAVRAAGHYGIVYPSLRHKAGTCLVALVPHAVQSVAQGDVVRLVWSGEREPAVVVPRPQRRRIRRN